jgi:hypothetical protein
LGTQHCKPINYWRTDPKTHAIKRTKAKVRKAEYRPFVIRAKPPGVDGWYSVLVADLRRALKGLTQAQTVRIGHITIKRSVLYGLLNSKSALTYDPIVE